MAHLLQAVLEAVQEAKSRLLLDPDLVKYAGIVHRIAKALDAAERAIMREVQNVAFHQERESAERIPK